MLWHSLSVEETLKKLEVSLEHGLSMDEVKQRQQTYGRNLLTAKKGKNLFLRLY